MSQVISALRWTMAQFLHVLGKLEGKPMPFRKLAVLSIVIVAGFAAQKSLAQTLRYNDGATISKALSGHSVVGQLSDGTSYCEYHDPNSGIFGRDFEVYAGNWAIRNNAICYSYPNEGTSCQYALITGKRIKFQYSDGSLASQGSIVAGNVCS